MNDNFWKKLEAILNESEIVIDRPKGSCHPKYPQILYPLDYGYLKNTSGGDGNEIDVWRGSFKDKTLNAIACTVDTLKRDTEIKLIVDCNENEIGIIEKFHMNRFMAAIIIKRIYGR